MDVSTDVPEGFQIINSYGPGVFRVSSVLWTCCIIITPERTVEWPILSFENLQIKELEPVLCSSPVIEILLIGTGENMERVPSSLKEYGRKYGVGIDSMDTGAACRTYNVLLSEGRRVAAALMVL